MLHTQAPLMCTFILACSGVRLSTAQGGQGRAIRYVDSRGIPRIKRTDYEGLKLHDLRHTQATLLISNGADIKTVQNRLGHSMAAPTMDIYAHAIEQNDRKAADEIGELLGGE